MNKSGSLFATLFLLAGLLASTASGADLNIEQVKTTPAVWPNQIKVGELLDYGSVKIPAGTVVDFLDFQGKDARFEFKGQIFLIEPEVTDLLAKANAIANGQVAGWHGRTADYLVRKAQQVTATGFAPLKAETIKDDTIFVVYYGSSECGFCASALPFMNHTLDLLDQLHPGRIVRVYTTGEAATAAARNYSRSLGAGWVAAPLGDRYLWSGLPTLVPGADRALNYPALALVTPKGEFLAAGMRQAKGTVDVDNVLRKLEQVLQAPAKVAAVRGP